MSNSNYEEDESIIQLSSEELTKMKNCLIYYIQNLNDLEALYLNVDNSISLSTNLDRIQSGYDESAIPIMKEIYKLIPQVLDVVQDKTLKALLSENFSKLEAFFRRFNIDYKEKNEEPKSPNYREYGRQLSKDTQFVPKGEPSEAWKVMTDSIKSRYESGKEEPDPFDDTEENIRAGLTRFFERDRERKKLQASFGLRREAELSIGREPKLYFKEVVLPKIADRIIREGTK